MASRCLLAMIQHDSGLNVAAVCRILGTLDVFCCSPLQGAPCSHALVVVANAHLWAPPAQANVTSRRFHRNAIVPIMLSALEECPCLPLPAATKLLCRP